jgi:hypothetical protein
MDCTIGEGTDGIFCCTMDKITIKNPQKQILDFKSESNGTIENFVSWGTLEM